MWLGRKHFRLKCDVELLCIWRAVCHPRDSNAGIGKIIVYKNFDAWNVLDFTLILIFFLSLSLYGLWPLDGAMHFQMWKAQEILDCTGVIDFFPAIVSMKT